MSTKTSSSDELTAKYEDALAQRDAQIIALNERVSDLAGFQKEAVDGRDAIAKLQAQLAEASQDLERSNMLVSAAQAAAKANIQTKDASKGLIDAAQDLVAALKKLGL